MNKIIVVHNRYTQYGGEDAVFDSETKILASYFEVIKYDTSNHQLSNNPLISFLQSIFNFREAGRVWKMIREHRPKLIHVHNDFPYLSSSIYLIAKLNRVPVIKTVHNFRLTCIKGTHYRNGALCLNCTRVNKISAVKNKCYREKYLTSLGAVLISQFNEMLNVSKIIHTYVALTSFSKNYLVSNGIPDNKIRIKPNSTTIDNKNTTIEEKIDLVYIGRLSEEKGISNLIKFWQEEGIDIRLTVFGNGPLIDTVKEAECEYIKYAGSLDPSEVPKVMRSAKLLIFPSEWYEGMPMTILEAFACGLPVVCRNIGGLSEIVDHAVNGLVFDKMDSKTIDRIRGILDDADLRESLSANAKRKYEMNYTNNKNLKSLIEIYSNVSGII
ncbi:glycosyltransferase family 4 protein [Deinococcus sp. LM3]|uniref:glycosyltransferase family 4 protein n=1 Tax=Deinococcus sp. LM3 TaxID=1938608 RepID=UPI00117F26E7|nr:glycosyltransferase family 4 protein [Deinococcus sp. LM3]